MSVEKTLFALGQALHLIEINGGEITVAERANFYGMPRKGLGMITQKLAALKSQDRLTDILDQVDADMVPAHANLHQQEIMMRGYYREGYLWSVRLDAKGLREAGELLFGESWMADVGRLTGDTRQRISDFNSGRRAVPIRVSEIVLSALKARGETISKLIATEPQKEETKDGPTTAL